MIERSNAIVALLTTGFFLGACAQTEVSQEDSDENAALLVESFDPQYGAGSSAPIEGAQYGNLALTIGEGTPVVFYYPAGPSWWQMQAEPLSADYMIVMVGEDLAVPPEGGLVSPTHLIDALENLKGTLGVESFNLVTHSISSRIAMELAIRRPDLINSLVLEEPAWAPTPDVEGPLPPPEQPECQVELTNPIDRSTCDFFAMQMGEGRFEALPQSIRQYLLDGAREQAAAIAASSTEGDLPMEAGPPQFDMICDQLGELDFPILFVRGEDTPAFFSAGMDYYEGCLSDHETAFIADATHMVHFENPEAYNAAVRSFVSTHSN